MKRVELTLGGCHTPTAILFRQRLESHPQIHGRVFLVDAFQFQQNVRHIRQHVRMQTEHRRMYQVHHQRFTICLHQLQHQTPFHVIRSAAVQQIVEEFHHRQIGIAMVERAGQQGTLNYRRNDCTLQEGYGTALRESGAQTEEIVNGVGMVFQAVFRLENVERWLNECLQHIQQTLSALIVDITKFVDENASCNQKKMKNENREHEKQASKTTLPKYKKQLC